MNLLNITYLDTEGKEDVSYPLNFIFFLKLKNLFQNSFKY